MTALLKKETLLGGFRWFKGGKWSSFCLDIIPEKSQQREFMWVICKVVREMLDVVEKIIFLRLVLCLKKILK